MIISIKQELRSSATHNVVKVKNIEVLFFNNPDPRVRLIIADSPQHGPPVGPHSVRLWHSIHKKYMIPEDRLSNIEHIKMGCKQAGVELRSNAY